MLIVRDISDKDWRAVGIGSTDIASIMRVDEYKTYNQTLLCKALGIADKVLNKNVLRGLHLEKYIRDHISRKFCCTLIPMKIVYDNGGSMLDDNCPPFGVNPGDMPILRTTVDGIDVEKRILVEIKCPMKSYGFTSDGSISVPIGYYAQMQYHMFVCEFDKCFFVCYCDNMLFVREIIRDDPFIVSMLNDVKSFWKDVLKLRNSITQACNEIISNCCVSENDLVSEAQFLKGYIDRMYPY